MEDIHPAATTPRGNNCKKKSKNRFSDDQIKSLESIFHSDSRPESHAKQQMADQLGLNPRQVAIWFQNRRARCKSKQIELDYTSLKSSYDNLTTRFESLRQEHHSLLSELQRLKTLQSRPRKGNIQFGFRAGSSVAEEINIISQHTHGHGGSSNHDDVDKLRGEDEIDKSTTNGYFKQEDDILINMVESTCVLAVSSGNCYSTVESIIDPADYLLLHDNCDSEWWESY